MMKALKAAAVLAGSIAVAGSAAPAFANSAVPANLTGAVETLAGDSVPNAKTFSAQTPVTEEDAVRTVTGATQKLNPAGGPTQLLGGLPLAK
ncbi:hypothetical protein [Streptomyces sp. NPDC003006]